MPAPVDHDARRRFVISRTSELIASAGIDATTIRTVAKAAGFSTSIVTHYFEDKAHLLTATYLDIVERRRARLLAALPGGPDPLRAALLAMAPLDDTSCAEWAVYCAFLGSGIGITGLSSVQAQSVETSAEILRGLVAQEIDAGRMQPTPPAPVVARDLIIFITGVGVVKMLDTEKYDRATVIDDIDRELARLRP